MRRLDAAVPLPEDRLRTTARRHRPLSRSARRVRLLSLAVLLGAALVGGPAWLVLSGRAGTMAERVAGLTVSASAQAGLKVHDVVVEGLRHTPRDHVLAALQIRRGDAMFGFDLDAARRRVESLAWVGSATVERRLPGIVRVEVEERRAVALWQRDGRHTVIDQHGEPIPTEVSAFSSLPVVVGQGAPAHAAELMDMLATEPAMMARVKAAVRVADRRWNLVLDDISTGTDVRLPEDGALAAWHRLAVLEREHGLLTAQVAMVDLRLPDRLILRQRTPEPARADAAEQLARTAN